MTPKTARHKTALSRNELSRPFRLAIEAGLLPSASSVFDYGCGRGDDVRMLLKQGIKAFGWDPVHRPRIAKRSADVVNLGYVVNVIEDPGERAEVLRAACAYAERLLIVSARLADEARGIEGEAYEDGVLTRLNTFQHFFRQNELREWINATLGVNAIAAAPGVFFVFRDEALAQSYLASRYRRRAAAPRQRQSDLLFDRHRELLDPLVTFVAARGRLPEDDELSVTPQLKAALGSIRRAFAVVRRVTGSEQWDRIRDDRSQDLLVYLALTKFGHRPRFGELPNDMRTDVRSFFGNYTQACIEADRFLFSVGDQHAVDAACRASPVGKLMPAGLYLHTSALSHLPPLLRVYEGCARSYVGTVDGANVVKLHRDAPQVTYLGYPGFEKEAHPALIGALIVNFRTLKAEYRDYSQSDNPPILHRKEEFVAADHPLRERFRKLTTQEEQRGLFTDTTSIGTKRGWAEALASRGIMVAGHQLRRVSPTAHMK